MDRINDIVVNGTPVLIKQRHILSKLLSLSRHIVPGPLLGYNDVPRGN